MSKTITIRKSAEDEAWLRAEQKRTKLSQGAILKNLLVNARTRQAAPKKHPLEEVIGGVKGLSPLESSKKGFEP